MQKRIDSFSFPEEMYNAAAKLICKSAEKAISYSGSFALVPTGGETPVKQENIHRVETEKLTAVVQAAVPRVTLSYPAIADSETLLFMIKGKKIFQQQESVQKK
ncbi:MAG: hypothetical protein KAS17_01110 [Victivallaceae bacterium]|nr:hypothetical protein [Victivallaceae bacterium]